MGSPDEELLKSIRYYQQSLDKYSSFGNNYKLMSIIEKLKRLPIATSHLEETGIGRTVNALRKLGGDVGDAAKGLVARWKEMVVQEEVKTKENTGSEAVEVCADENDNGNHEEKDNGCREAEEDTQHHEKQSSSSSHRISDTEKKSSEKHRKDKNKYSSNNGSGSLHEKKDKHKGNDSSSKKRRRTSDSSEEERGSKRQHDSSNLESEEEVYEKKHSKSKRKNGSESSEDEEEEDRDKKSKKSRHRKDSSDSEDSYKKHRSSKSSRDGSLSKPKSTESKRHDYESSSDREKSKTKHKSDSKPRRDSDCDESKSGTKHKSRKSYESSSDNEEARRKSKHDSKTKHDKDSSKSRESKSHSSRSDKHEKKDKKESKREEPKDKHSHKKDESQRHDEKHKKPKDERENGKKEKSSGKPEESSKSSSSGSKHRSSSEKKKDKVSAPKTADTKKIMNGIDSESGASFAEALGMCGPMVSRSSGASSSKKKPSSLPSSEKPRSTASSVKPEKTEVAEEDVVPNLLREQPPEPLNINISSLLPEITPNYRPVGFPVDSQPKRVLSQDEALSQVIYNKNMRTKVYSGNKSYGKVETLFDLCVRILQDNIDALEYTGGVPYLILKPVLEKATPDQLFNMEHHNPYLIEDTDELWLLHCQKEFRNKKREELESWREMYMRCLDEREARLNAITANIKQSQDKSTPIRTTKLAYIDSVVKPPRNVARKQAKNGITFDKKPAQTPASRVAALASSGDAKKVAVPNPGARAADRSSSSSSASAIKPKKAPLMAKTLSFLKNRFRR